MVKQKYRQMSYRKNWKAKIISGYQSLHDKYMKRRIGRKGGNGTRSSEKKTNKDGDALAENDGELMNTFSFMACTFARMLDAMHTHSHSTYSYPFIHTWTQSPNLRIASGGKTE